MYCLAYRLPASLGVMQARERIPLLLRQLDFELARIKATELAVGSSADDGRLERASHRPVPT
jgi:hypothetical protein